MKNAQGKPKALPATLVAFVAALAVMLGVLTAPAALATDASRAGATATALPEDCKILPGGFDKLKDYPDLVGRDQEILAKTCEPGYPGFYYIRYVNLIKDEQGHELYAIAYSVKIINYPGVDAYAEGAIRLPAGGATPSTSPPTPGGEVTPNPSVTAEPGTTETPDPGTTTPAPGTSTTPAPGTSTTPAPGTSTAPSQPGNSVVQRVAGNDRVATAIEAYKAGGFKSDVAVLVSGKTYPDALAAAPLADQLDAPILVTASPQLEASVLQVLKEKKVTNVVIVGGERSVPAAVANRLKSEGFKVERIAGGDRFATALEVVKAVGAKRPNQKLFVVDGTNFADALAVGAVVNKHDGAIVLSNGKMLPQETAGFLKAAKVDVVAVGGNAAASLDGYGEPGKVSKVVGLNRHQTAVKVAAQFAPEAKYAAVVSGDQFADALGAAALAADNDGVLLLTPRNGLDKDTTSHLRGSKVKQVSVVGGPNTVMEAVLQAVKQALPQ